MSFGRMQNGIENLNAPVSFSVASIQFWASVHLCHSGRQWGLVKCFRNFLTDDFNN